ncbi:MAG TPA: hypothetical protein PKY25_00340 [Bacilli bacterium]|nr:hypothetical protein [Bacilli bacterium]
MNFLDVVEYDYEEKFKGDKPDHIFKRMILRQIETIIPYETIAKYMLSKDLEGLKLELSKYGDADEFLKEYDECEN